MRFGTVVVAPASPGSGIDAGTIRSALGLAPLTTAGVSKAGPLVDAVSPVTEWAVVEGPVSGSVCRRLDARSIVPISRDQPDASNGPVGSRSPGSRSRAPASSKNARRIGPTHAAIGRVAASGRGVVCNMCVAGD